MKQTERIYSLSVYVYVGQVLLAPQMLPYLDINFALHVQLRLGQSSEVEEWLKLTCHSFTEHMQCAWIPMLIAYK